MNWLKKKLKRKRERNIIAMLLPTSWEQLTDKQLYDVYGLANQPLSATQLKTICLFRWTNLKVNFELDNGLFECTINKQKVDLSATQIACALNTINFITEVPESLVRLSQIKRFKARPANIEGTSFREYIFIDNLYQGFIHTQNTELLKQMTRILYDAPNLFPNQAEKINTFYWWTALKQTLAKRFPHFFANADNADDNTLGQPSLHQKLTEAMNAQVRALTGGDITKEEKVLNTECWRAFAELDAIAKEQQLMKQKYGNH